MIHVPTANAAGPKRFEAVLADGTRVAGDELVDWADEKSQPKLEGQAVFDPNNPFRWVIDRTIRALEPEAYVEFFGGDRLPGSVVGYDAGDAFPLNRIEPHLLVVPSAEVRRPGVRTPIRFRVGTRWVRRIVFEGSSAVPFRPNTLHLRDGRVRSFSALRWSSGGVVLLLEEGLETVPFAEIAEVHLAGGDPWDAYRDALAVLTPTCAARLMQIETADGLRALTSTERFHPQPHGNRGKPESWRHGVQPAWSLDVLWVSHRNIRVRRFFDAHRVPLTLFTPASVRQSSTFGSQWRWRKNESVSGGSLEVNGEAYGWGFGVHAENELEFHLPPYVKTFRTRAGLDGVAGAGGCAKPIVLLRGETESILFQSNPLIGNRSVVDTGAVAVASTAEKPMRLVLRVDPMHEGRPKGADPFDVRDSLNWGEPELELDAAALKQAVGGVAFNQFAATTGWAIKPGPMATPEAPGVGGLTVVNAYDEKSGADPYFQPRVSVEAPFAVVSRKLQFDKDHRWLAVAVEHPPGKKNQKPPEIQVRFDHRPAAEFTAPVRTSRLQPDPLLTFIPPEFRGREVNVEVVLIPGDPELPLVWRGAAALSHRPGLLPLFEDNVQLAGELIHGDGSVTAETEEPRAGDAWLRVAPPRAMNPAIDGWRYPIREVPEIGEYRFIRFAWKKEGGNTITLELAHEGRFANADDQPVPLEIQRNNGIGPNVEQSLLHRERGLERQYRYTGGPVLKDTPSVRAINNAPAKWTDVTRDLAGDFGEFDLTGLALVCPDGISAAFDSIYLGRSAADFRHIPELLADGEPGSVQTNEGNVLKYIRDPAYVSAAVSDVAPQFSVSGYSDGIQLLKEHAGKPNVMRTHPRQKNEPCRLRAAVEVAPGKSTVLEMTVSTHPGADWKLVVNANGGKLHEAVIKEADLKEGWLNVSVDLSRYAGKRVLLDVENASNDWKNEYAYWKRVEVVEK